MSMRDGDPPSSSLALAGWAVGLEPTAEDLALSERALMDTVAVGLAARREPIIAVAAVLSDEARWAVACHILDFDDLHMPSTTHISTVCVPVALALGGAARSYLAGAGVMARVGTALGWPHYSAGWHATTTAGAIGAAAGAAVALGLDVHGVATAMALAVPAAGGVQRSFGTDAKALQVGFAAHAGVRAARLAAAGASADWRAVDDWLALVGGSAERMVLSGPAIPDGLAIKLYPCCYALQRPIGAAAAVRAQGLEGSTIQRIVVRTPKGTVKPLIHSRPRTGLEAKFSLEYAVAAALLGEHVGFATFTDGQVGRAEATRLAALVEVDLGEGGYQLLSGQVEVEVHTTDGVRRQVLADPPGSPKNPPSKRELQRKIADCLAGTPVRPPDITWAAAPDLLRTYLFGPTRERPAHDPPRRRPSPMRTARSLTMESLPDEEREIVEIVRDFVDRDVKPVVQEMDHTNTYPEKLIEMMKHLGIYGLAIPEPWGDVKVSTPCYVLVTEELSRGWMSLAGAMGGHTVVAKLIQDYGTQQQQDDYLPRMATGELRATMALTEPGGGSDLQAMRTTAQRDGDEYVINGSKTWISNARRSDLIAVLCKTDPEARPKHKGVSILLVEKGPGFTLSRDLPKLGYKGIESCEIAFEQMHVPASSLLGESEGTGFAQMMRGLEVGRLQVAGRALGVGRAALEDSLRYAQERESFGVPIWKHQSIGNYLAEMVTKLTAARQLTLFAARQFDAGKRADMEAGMAKLFASEVAMEIALDAVRIHGGYGYSTEFDVERYFRDAPLMIVGEGTNEILRNVIARQLVKRGSVAP